MKTHINPISKSPLKHSIYFTLSLSAIHNSKMAESPLGNTIEGKRYAVVTGANKGIGYGICEQLAANNKGIVVVLTARDENRGLEALEKLKKEKGFSDEKVLFHKLDVSDSSSVECLAKFIDSRFGKLDILVNNAGISGMRVDIDVSKASESPAPGEVPNFVKHSIQDHESATECIQINYYGAKRMIETFVPLLQKSKSPRIVNVSSGLGQLKVNNAGIGPVRVDTDYPKASESALPGEESNFLKHSVQDLESATRCIQTNYYGAKRMIEAFVPLLQKSKSPRIVNVSSGMGQLKYVPTGKTKEVLADGDGLTVEKIDEVIDDFLKDVRDDTLKAKGWCFWSAYTISKAAMNAYTRILARKYPEIKVNAVCPGPVKTDINYNTSILTIEEGATGPVKLALLPDDGPSGLFFSRGEVSSFSK